MVKGERKRILIAARIISSAWSEQGARYFCIATEEPYNLDWFERDDFVDIIAFLTERWREDLWWCPHGYGCMRRLAVNAVASPFLWSDLDRTNPNGLPFLPTIAWLSSPGKFAAMWRIDTPILEGELRNQINNCVMRGDQGGGCITKLLRIPGTVNHKYADAPYGRLLWANSNVHRLAAIKALLPKPKKLKPQRLIAHNSACGKLDMRFVRQANALLRSEYPPPDQSSFVCKVLLTFFDGNLVDPNTLHEKFVRSRIWPHLDHYGSERLDRDIARLLRKRGLA